MTAHDGARLHVYVGPTLPAAEILRQRPDARIRPPAAHGDLLRERFSPHDVALIIDGYFHHTPPVRHKEILSLLADGVRVVGCSSMGALRAAELHPYGMVGAGVVFELFRDGRLEADDEVAVIHAEGPEYRALSEPLVNIRHVVATARARDLITPPAAVSIVSTASGLHYARRSWRAVEAEECRRRPGRWADFRALDRFRVAFPEVADLKAADALTTLCRLPDLLDPPPSDPARWADSADWRSRHLYAWLAAFSGTEVEGVRVGDAEVIRHQQLYHQDFPRRWREFALSRIGRGTEDPLAEPAMRYWLTAREHAALPVLERARRVLVRSYRPPRSDFDLVRAFPDLVADPEARRAVAEAVAVNAEVSSWGDRRGPDRLSPSVVRNHLVETWGQDAADPAALDAAARDRGLGSADEACRAVRQFFLRSYVRSLRPGPGRGSD